MTYLFAVLYLACVYLRPAETITGWEEFPFAAVAALPALVAVVGSFVLRPRRLFDLPQDWFVLVFLVVIGASNAAWGWMSGALHGTLAMVPAVFCYFLLRSAIESPAHLRGITCALVALTLFQAVNGIVQFHTGVGIGGVAPIEAHSLLADDESESNVWRIRGTGIFNDPNDLALSLVVVVPFLAGPLVRRKTRPGVRILAAFLLVPIVAALYYTNSRGGTLGLAAAALPYAYRRFGRLAGAVAAVGGLALLVALGPTRMANLDASESSAQGRVQSWAEGLQMFKSHPLLGVGFGRYTDFNRLVAHNSFVHTLGELGFLGAFAFVGMGYWFFQSSRRRPFDGGEGLDRDLCQSGLALSVCAMFLSRQYNVTLFVWLALSAAYVQLMAGPPRLPPTRQTVHLARIAAITAGGVICTYLAVRLLGNWSV